MRTLLITFFAFIGLFASAQVTGTYKGTVHDKEATLVLTEKAGKIGGTYVTSQNNYVVYIDTVNDSNGFEGAGKDREAGLTSFFTGAINEKELTLTIVTRWLDQTSTDVVKLKKVD